jgi:hypothetical protein
MLALAIPSVVKPVHVKGGVPDPSPYSTMPLRHTPKPGGNLPQAATTVRLPGRPRKEPSELPPSLESTPAQPCERLRGWRAIATPAHSINTPQPRAVQHQQKPGVPPGDGHAFMTLLGAPVITGMVAKLPKRPYRSR